MRFIGYMHMRWYDSYSSPTRSTRKQGYILYGRSDHRHFTVRYCKVTTGGHGETGRMTNKGTSWAKMDSLRLGLQKITTN